MTAVQTDVLGTLDATLDVDESCVLLVLGGTQLEHQEDASEEGGNAAGAGHEVRPVEDLAASKMLVAHPHQHGNKDEHRCAKCEDNTEEDDTHVAFKRAVVDESEQQDGREEPGDERHRHESLGRLDPC